MAKRTTARTPGGIVYPVQPEPPPEPKTWPLELTETEDRRHMQDVFTELLNMTAVGARGGIRLPPIPDKAIAEARKALVLALACQLLGPDFGYEEPC